MKTFKQHILEKLKIRSSSVKYTLFPKTKEELKSIIEDEISKNGNECSLNHIDVSKITDMARMFEYSKFNGDISGWDVSNVKDMKFMFFGAKFNGDISEWDVSNVEDMERMFKNSDFNGDISQWDVLNVKDMACMFMSSDFNGDISSWNVLNLQTWYEMFKYCPLQKNPPKWYKK
jgi:hypothetical protein